MINSGIGTPVVRLALVAFWAVGFGTLIVVHSKELRAPELLGAAALLTAAVLLTHPRDDSFSAQRGLALSLLATGAVGIIAIRVLAGEEEGRVLGWAVEYASYLGALTAVRVRRVLGAATVVGCLAWFVLVGVFAPPQAEVNFGTLVTCSGILAAGLVWGTILPRARRTLLSLRDNREREFQLEQLARDSAAHHEARIAHLVERVAPELHTIAAGFDLCDEQLAQVRAREGEIRDTLTAPDLDEVDVRNTIFRARLRGVDVSIIDVRDAHHRLAPQAVQAISSIIDAVDAGRVAVKFETPSLERAHSGSIVVVRDGRAQRYELPPDSGTVAAW